MSVEEINAKIQKEKAEGKISAKDISDGRHTFRKLYKNRMILFCTLCNCHSDIFWKSKKHFDEETDPMFNDDFIAGINTPEGVVTYHFKLEFWDLFQVPEIEWAPKYDFYDNEMVLKRIYSLSKNKKGNSTSSSC